MSLLIYSWKYSNTFTDIWEYEFNVLRASGKQQEKKKVRNSFLALSDILL